MKQAGQPPGHARMEIVPIGLVRFAVALVLVWTCALPAQKYDGPRPPKPDLPYLQHADTLVPTEAAEAMEEKRGNETVYSVAGAGSPVRTPIAEPIFLFASEKIAPESLELYRLTVKGGNRQIVFPEKKRDAPRPFRLSVTRLDDKLYRIEVNERMGLENGSYSLTPAGSNQIFCFDVY